jgi:hypothetical protein
VPASAGSVLTRPADSPQVIPRIRPDTRLPRGPDPEHPATIARIDAPAAPPDQRSADPDGEPAADPTMGSAGTDNPPTTDAPTDAPTSDAPTSDAPTIDAPTIDADPEDAHTDDVPADRSRHRRHGWIWAGLAVFWLLALGAGLITLASLGAPHFLCTGTAAKGLACEGTGTAIAAVLTIALIVAVGSVSVLVIEQRAQGRTAWRWLGIGVVVLVVVASCGYLLIRTIGG